MAVATGVSIGSVASDFFESATIVTGFLLDAADVNMESIFGCLEESVTEQTTEFLRAGFFAAPLEAILGNL